MIAPGMTDGASSVLFLNFVMEIDSSMENQYKGISLKTVKMDRIIIVIITINNAYLLKWCITIPNDYPVLV